MKVDIPIKAGDEVKYHYVGMNDRARNGVVLEVRTKNTFRYMKENNGMKIQRRQIVPQAFVRWTGEHSHVRSSWVDQENLIVTYRYIKVDGMRKEEV